jgi:hypothetical protein
MNSIIELNLKKKIIDLYESNQLITNKINLDTNALDIEDPSYENFRNEIFFSLKNRYKVEEDLKYSDDIEELEEVVQETEGDEYIDLSILEKIDEKVLSILHYLNVGLFNKNELKAKIVNDMLTYLYDLSNEDISITKIIKRIPKIISRNEFLEKIKKLKDYELKKFFVYAYGEKNANNKEREIIEFLSLKDNIKIWYILNSIPWYIENHIEHEFNEYQLKKNQIQKELVYSIISRISEELNMFFEKHKEKKVKNINKTQIKNFLNYIFTYFDKNYIQVDKKNKKLNNEDYLFLKSKIKIYITQKYLTVFKG